MTHKVVPVEPTAGMVSAAQNEMYSHRNLSAWSTGVAAVGLCAGIAAAPTSDYVAVRRGDLEEIVGRIDEWAAAYPLTIFPTPDHDKARKALESEGLTLDAISASAMRHVITQVAEIIAPLRNRLREATNG